MNQFFKTKIEEIDLGAKEDVKLLVGSHNRIIIEKLYGPNSVKDLKIVWEGSDWNIRKKYDKLLSQQAVKEFIRLLKEEFENEIVGNEDYPITTLNNVIDKLAGDKLK